VWYVKEHADGRRHFLYYYSFVKEKYVLWEKTYISHMIIEYVLYPFSLVNSQV